jgi:hypothetical protein
MYNQDTDEGGMGKKHTGPKPCKCGDPKCKDPKCVKKRDSVLQGYGGEQNDTGEVHWSGTGSPYPKNAGERSHIAEDLELQQSMGTVAGQTDIQNTTRRLGIGRGAANLRGRKPAESKDTYRGYAHDYKNTANNSEGGLKAPEARENAVVYNDKTLDQPSETPLENQAKIKKGDKEEQEEFDQINPNFSKKPKKKKAIMTNIQTRLKNLDFMLKKLKKPYKPNPRKAEGWQKFFEEYKDKPEKAPLPDPKSKKIPKRAVGGSKQELPDKSPKDKKIREGMVSTFGKASVITNIHSRLKSLDFMLNKAKEKQRPNYDDMTGTRGRGHGADDNPDRTVQGEKDSKTRGDKWMKYYYYNTNEDLAEVPIPTSPATLRNYLKPTDPKYPTPKELTEEREKKEAKAKKLKKSFFMRVKDGEFGGMNTGETEWTEPRDTANSRTKRDNDVA